MRWVKEAETWSHQRPHPQCEDSQSKRSHRHRTFSWGARICALYQAPEPLGLALMRWPPKHLALKDHQGWCQRGVRNGDSTLKGLACRLTYLAIQHKSQVWKVSRPYMNGIHFLTLKHLLARKKSVRIISRNGSTSSHHFCTFFLTC